MDDTTENKPAPDVPDMLTIPLRKQVVFGTETYTELNLHALTSGDVEKFMKQTDQHGNLAAFNQMIASNANISKLAIDMMHALDTKKAREYLANFL